MAIEDDQVTRIGNQLYQAVGFITVEEFRSQDARYDADSRRGRELLYLIANPDWLLKTTEVVEVDRAQAIMTSLRLDLNLDNVEHEAFHDRSHFWLPLLTLPLLSGTAAPGASDPAADPALSLTVRDNTGGIVTWLSQAEVDRRISAALAEIVLNMAAARWSGPGARPSAGRSERLVLSAAINRVIRSSDSRSRLGLLTTAGTPEPSGRSRPGVSVGHGTGGRLREAQEEVVRMLAVYLREYATPPEAGTGDDTSARRTRRIVTQRAAQIIDTLSNSLCVVVRVTRDDNPMIFYIDLDGQRLVRRRDSVFRRPRVRLDINLLLPSTEVDRHLEIHLPSGVAYEQSRDGVPKASVRVDVKPPRSFVHLRELTTQVLEAALDRPDPDPVSRCLADMTVSRIDAALESLTRYTVRPMRPTPVRRWMTGWRTGRSGPPTTNPNELLTRGLGRLRGHLTALDESGAPAGSGGADVEGVRAAWGDLPMPGRLRRNTAVRAVSPGVVKSRTEAVDDLTHQATPIMARAVVDVAVTESELFSSARFAGWMSLILMGAVYLFLLGSNNNGNLEVIGPALTIFAAIQAGRVDHPDRSTFRGMLSGSGYWLILISILPTVILAVALAFVYAPVGVNGSASGRSGAETAALLAISGQLLFLLLLYRGPLSVPHDPRRAPGFVLATPPMVDHLKLEILHSVWWRGTTADALLLGRDAYAYLVPETDRGPTADGYPDAAADLADWLQGATGQQNGTRAPANLLAMLRAGTARRTMNFVVLRSRPSAGWRRAHDARLIELATDRLAPKETPAEYVDIMVGTSGDDLDPAVSEHPLHAVFQLATDYWLGIVDAQLPVPPPFRSAGHPTGSVRWMRVRVGVNDAELPRLRQFLLALHEASVKGSPSRRGGPSRPWHIVLQVVPEIAARTYFAAPDPEDALTGNELVRAGDLDVLAGTSDEPDEPHWCTAVVCGQARNGFESDVLNWLSARHPKLRLAGVTTAALHGISTSFLLLRGDHDTAGEFDSDDLLSAVGRDQILVPLVSWDSARELGLPPGPGSGALLRLRVRATDRPGLVNGTLRGLEGALATRVTTKSSEPLVRVWHAHMSVLEGRSTTIRLVLRLPENMPGLEAWGPADLEALERDIRRGLSSTHPAGPPGGGHDNPVVSAQLLRTRVAVGAADSESMA